MDIGPTNMLPASRSAAVLRIEALARHLAGGAPGAGAGAGVGGRGASPPGGAAVSARGVVSSATARSGLHPLRPMASPSPLDAAAMQAHQDGMPRWPIPQLESTTAQLCDVVRPLVSDSDFAVFRRQLSQFLDKEAPGLHDDLLVLDRQLKHTSFVTGFWNDSYLTGRYPVVINSNPTITFVPMRDPATGDRLSQAAVAARLAHGCAVVMANLYGHTYEPETERGQPLCMGQAGELLGCARIPRRGQDELSTPGSRGEVPTHIVVLRGDSVVEVPVMRCTHAATRSEPAEFNLVPLPALEDTFARLLAALPGDGSERSWASLTGLDRDTWADVRASAVEASVVNKASLDTIDSALMVVSLPSHSPASETAFEKTLLAGDAHTPLWFDKYNVLVTPDGMAGGVFEHSSIDGHSLRRIIQELYHCSTGGDSGFPPLVVPAELPGALPTRQLPWVSTAALEDSVASAYDSLCARRDNLSLSTVVVPSVTKRGIKAHKVSPDAFAQLGMQLAFKRVATDHAHMPSVYESCSMRHFLDGRTETIRPVTAASTRAVALMSSPLYSAAERRAAIVASSDAHVIRCRAAASGRGCDRHLFALAALAAQRRGKLPAVFTSVAMRVLNTIDLSTSTIHASSCASIAFGPVSPRGFGVAYQVLDDGMRFVATSFKRDGNGKPTGRDSGAMADALATAVKDLNDALVAGR